jgi:hypothetical protein
MTGDNDIENIVFTQNADESYDVMTTKYEITTEELEANPIQTPTPVDFTILRSTNLSTAVKSIIIYVVMCDNDGSGGYGEDHIAGDNCTSSDHLYTVSIVINSGSSSSAGNGNLPNAGGAGGAGSIITSAVGGGYTSAQLSFIKSIDDFNDARTNFMNSDANAITAVLNYSTAATQTQANAVRAFLNNTNSFWISTQSAESQNSIYNTLIQNNFSNQSVAFINQCITRMKADPIFTSIIPFLIEKGIDDSALDACTKEILNKLKNLQQIDIAKMLAKLDNTTIVHKPNYNTTISSQNPINSTNSYVYAQTNFDVSAPFPSNIQSPFNYHIDISPSYLSGSLLSNSTPPKKPTELSIARTLLHEIIHAYFDSLYDDCYYYNNCTAIKQFPNLWSDYERHYLQLPNTTIVTDPQHLTTANNFVKILASALQEYQTGIPVANNAEPDQVYKDLVWQGLQGSQASPIPAFILAYPAGSDAELRWLRINQAEDVQKTTPQTGNLPQISPISNPCN